MPRWCLSNVEQVEQLIDAWSRKASRLLHRTVHIIVHNSTTGYRCSILLNNIEQIATKAMQCELNYVSESNLTSQSSSGISEKVKEQCHD
jgi:hypothetical protein